MKRVCEISNDSEIYSLPVSPLPPPAWVQVPNEVCQMFLFPTTIPMLQYDVEFMIFLSWRTVSKWFENLVNSACMLVKTIPISIFKLLTSTILRKFQFRNITFIEDLYVQIIADSISFDHTQNFKELTIYREESVPGRTNGRIFTDQLQYHTKLEKLHLINYITYDHIRFLKTRLTTLSISNNNDITGYALNQFTNLTSLTLDNTAITSNDISTLTNLTKLSLDNTKLNTCLTNLTNLCELTLKCISSVMIRDFNTISQLPKLRTLHISITHLERNSYLSRQHNTFISEYQYRAFKVQFPQLCTLDIMGINEYHNENIMNYYWLSDNALEDIPVYDNLHTLNISWGRIFRDHHVSRLTNLTSLNLDSNEWITDFGISVLTGLNTLSISNNRNITDDSVSLLTNLTTLNAQENKLITSKAFSLLTCLQTLDICHSKYKQCIGLRNMTNLTDLNMVGNNTVMNGENDIQHLYKLRRLIIDYVGDFSSDVFRNLTNLVILRAHVHTGGYFTSRDIFDICHRDRK